MTQFLEIKPFTTALLGLLIALLTPLSGCRSAPESPDAAIENPGVSRAQIRPLEPRIDAIAGRPFLTPIQLTPPITPIGSVELEVAIDGTAPIDARLLWVSRDHEPQSAPHDPIAAWLDAPTLWRAHDLDQLVGGQPPPGDGFWALLVDCPATAHQRTLSINGREASVQWLSPEPPGLQHSDSRLFKDPSQELRRALSNADRDPLNRWRVRLLDDRLRAPRRSVIDEHASRFGHEAIEIMAQQAEWRWRLALDRVATADPFLGAELLDRLTAIAEFQPGATAPIWPSDDAALTSLRTALLDARATDEQIIDTAREALRSAPGSTAWVIDDAGWVQPATGRTVSIIGVAERAGAAGLVRSGVGADRAGPMTALPAFGVARTTVQAPAYRSRLDVAQTNATTSIVGRAESVLPLLPVGLPVEAPGFRLGPGFTPWTLDRWTAASPPPAPDRLAFYALLHERAGRDDSEPAWQLHIECPTPAGGDPGMLRLHLGPSNNPSAILRIDPAGLQQDQLNAPLQREPVSIAQEPGAWVATIDIPASAIGPGGVLRLAIERFNARGERATWPRPVMPWQEAPGRAALDLGAWNSLGTGEY